MGIADTGSNTGRDGDHEEPDFAGQERPEGDTQDLSGDSVEQFQSSEQLELGDDDVRLPWLEGDDDEYEEILGDVRSMCAPAAPSPSIQAEATSSLMVTFYQTLTEFTT